MSSAVYPLGMNSMPASGYTHQSKYYNKQYIPWKGTGANSFPVGTAPGHIRPLTNNDPGNVFQTGFGLARPIKHYRKGRFIPPVSIEGVNNLNVNSPYNDVNLSINENALINYNINRFVRSSTPIPLGGSSSSSGLLNDMLGSPGSYLVKQNTCVETNINSNNLNNNWNLIYSESTNFYSNIKLSSTGKYILATSAYTNKIIVSSDYGKSWNLPITLTKLVGSIGSAVSSSGQYQIVVDKMGQQSLITYFSNDYGSTWTETTYEFDARYVYGRVMDSVCISSDGKTILIGIDAISPDMVVNDISDLYINILIKSSDYGKTYNFLYDFSILYGHTLLPGLAMSSNGKYITAVGISTSGHNIFISSDFGNTFNTSNNINVGGFDYPIRMSSNGQYQITQNLRNNLICFSNDYGENWNTNIPTVFSYEHMGSIDNLFISSDGSIVFAYAFNYLTSKEHLYISKDNGSTWTFLGNISSFLHYSNFTSSMSMSLDGTLMAYVATNEALSEIYTLNNLEPINCNDSITENCKTCEGTSVVASYKPNLTNLSENPEPNSNNRVLCCNQERFAKQRVIYASTNLKKNYYTTTKQYLQNRCKTFDQKAFNFLSYRTNGLNDNNNPYYYSVDGNNGPKPGGPLALTNTYLANCQSNTQLYEGTELAFIYQMIGIMKNENIITQTQIDEFNATGINSIPGFFDWIQGLPAGQKGSALVVFEVFINNPYSGMPPSGPTNPAGCQLSVYKPNNYQFAKQGAVSSSTRLLKLNVDTISTNAASIQNYNNTGQFLVTANQLYAGDANNTRNLMKNKTTTQCNPQWPFNFSQSGQFQNKKFCKSSRV